MELKHYKDWTTLPYFYCNKQQLIDTIIRLHVDREIKNDSLGAQL